MKDLNIYDIQTFFCTGTDGDNLSLLYRPVPVGTSEINTYTKTDFAMDTVVSETLYTTGEDITADVIEALKNVEENWISWTEGKLPDLSDQSECRQYSDRFSGNGSLSEAGIGAFRGFRGCYGSYHGKNHPSLGY